MTSPDQNSKSLYPEKNAVLVFANGEYIDGYGVGKKGITSGEICFNTSITGYQEILTDPSYLGQIITFTFPHIGNVGTNDNDFESKSVRAGGIIIREPITKASNYRSTNDFENWLIQNSVTGISGIDTRKITQIIRKNGAGSIAIIFQDKIDQNLIKKTANEIKKTPNLKGVELASKASQSKEYHWNDQGKWLPKSNKYQKVSNKKKKIVAIDYGAKSNILRSLTSHGANVVVVGAKANFKEILSHNPDGVFLSNGPGDPFETFKYSGDTIKEIIKNKVPVFGICLGHQLLALALGCKTSKMTQGHRGANHPVKNLHNGKVEITSQNHGFSVDKNSIPTNVEITHLSLFDNSVEGIKFKDGPAFSVQYHPESSPGPEDSQYLFADFMDMIKAHKIN